MKIYTKILIGMAVGAVIGLTLGPKSEFLEADLYKVESAKSITLLSDRHDPDSALSLPSVELKLRIQEIEMVSLTDAKSDSYELPGFARVKFNFSRQMALLDKDDSLKSALGVKKIGDEAEAWLAIKHVELPSGGFIATPQPISQLGDTIVTYLAPIGELFLRLIQMVIVPLVFASLLVGIAGLGDVRKLGRLGGKTLVLYLCTTAMAVTIGLVAAHLIDPGSFVSERDKAALTAQFQDDAGAQADKAANAPSAIDNILNIVPKNVMASLTGGEMLQIIFFTIIFGIALTMIKRGRPKQVIDFFDTVQHAMILIIHMVMAIAPFGVAALLAKVVGESGISILSALLVYALTVIAGLLVLATLVYGSLVTFVAKLPPVKFLKAIRPAQLIAFSTSSSSATLPVTMECAEQELGVSKPVSSFVLPLGSTVNMDGTALYQGVAAIFIAQVFEVDLSLGAQIGIVLTATAASIGAAGVPGAGMITLAMVLTAAGIPTVGVALILGVDRLLDMFRTAVNVTGDLAVTSVMAVSEGEKLRVLSPEEDAADADRGFEHRLDHSPEAIEPSTQEERRKK